MFVSIKKNNDKIFWQYNNVGIWWDKTSKKRTLLSKKQQQLLRIFDVNNIDTLKLVEIKNILTILLDIKIKW